MSYYSPSIEKLIESFEKLPSIGNKTAARLAFYILDASEEETNEFIESIQNAKKNLKYCSQCYNITDTDPCPLCANTGMLWQWKKHTNLREYIMCYMGQYLR